MKIDYGVGDVVMVVNKEIFHCDHNFGWTGTDCPPLRSIFRVAAFENVRSFLGNSCGCIGVVTPNGKVVHASRLRRIPKAPEHEADFIRRIAKPKERVRDREEV